MATIRCPVCKKQFDSERSEAMPFCSDRCKQIDLARWLDERYTLPVDRPEDAGDDGTAVDDG
jgi:endogenous inhibitor of DNA gyrase (YacG/DUF329 family)